MKTIFFFFFPILIFAQGSRLLRQPTIHENKVAFVYANDLWLSSTDGSQAIRLTSHEGYESAPHFSPDGKHIAFTGQYDGNIDVYVIPTNGGSPERLTYHLKEILYKAGLLMEKLFLEVVDLELQLDLISFTP